MPLGVIPYLLTTLLAANNVDGSRGCGLAFQDIIGFGGTWGIYK
jgi:hypothetical protein